MTDQGPKDEFMADLATRGRLRLQLAVAVQIEGGAIRVGGPLALESLEGLAVSVGAVPVSALVAQSWIAKGTFVDSQRIRLQSVDREPARHDTLRISRTSRRIEHPDWRASIRACEADSSFEAQCLDLSAGGVGLHLSRKVPLEVGDLVLVELQWHDAHHRLEGLIAHTEFGRTGARLGVQFVPLDRDAASSFYDSLNDCAGEPLVDARPTLEAVPLFEDALRHGSVTLTREFDARVDGNEIVVSEALPERWLKGPARLQARNAQGAWTAIVLGDGSGIFTLTQIGHSDDSRPDVRTSGYRVSPPPRTQARLRTSVGGAPIEAIPVDLSRGGIGVDVPGDVDLSPARLYVIDLVIPATNFSRQLQGRIAFARPDAAGVHTRVGIRFLDLSNEARQDLDTTLSRLEDRLVFRQFMVFGTGVLLFLLAVIVLGTLVTPERAAAPSPADATMDSSPQDASKR